MARVLPETPHSYGALPINSTYALVAVCSRISARQKVWPLLNIKMIPSFVIIRIGGLVCKKGKQKYKKPKTGCYYNVSPKRIAFIFIITIWYEIVIIGRETSKRWKPAESPCDISF